MWNLVSFRVVNTNANTFCVFGSIRPRFWLNSQLKLLIIACSIKFSMPKASAWLRIPMKQMEIQSKILDPRSFATAAMSACTILSQFFMIAFCDCSLSRQGTASMICISITMTYLFSSVWTTKLSASQKNLSTLSKLEQDANASALICTTEVIKSANDVVTSVSSRSTKSSLGLAAQLAEAGAFISFGKMKVHT